jgi:hypothetical protein
LAADRLAADRLAAGRLLAMNIPLIVSSPCGGAHHCIDNALCAIGGPVLVKTVVGG